MYTHTHICTYAYTRPQARLEVIAAFRRRMPHTYIYIYLFMYTYQFLFTCTYTCIYTQAYPHNPCK